MNNEVVLRRMTASDIPGAVEIEQKCFSMPWSEKAFADSLALDYSVFFVASIDEKIVGYVGLYIAYDEGDITNVAVLPEYRRKGIATSLLEKIVIDAKEKNLVAINLEVRKSNRSAIALYEKNGFVDLGHRKNFYEKPTEDAVIMKKQLERR